jgi:hypothetical protein
MSILVVEELMATPLKQKLTATENDVITALRPHLYIHNSPAGSLRMDIYDSADTTLLKSSETIAISTLKTLAFAHGYFRFNVSWGLVDVTQYTIRLVSTGYTFATSAYVGWVKDVGDSDYRKYAATYSGNTIGYNSAFDLEIWKVTDNVRGL